MTDVGFEIIPEVECPTCHKLDEHRHALQGFIIQLEARDAALTSFFHAAAAVGGNDQERINALTAGLSRLFDHAAEVRSYADGWEWKYKQSWDEEMEAARALLEAPKGPL